MINAVIELGDRRVHEVMVPRIAIVVAAGVGDVRRGDRPVRRGGPLAGPASTRARSTRSSGSSTRRTCCRSSSPTSARGPTLRIAAPDARVRARVDDDRRPAPRVPAAQGPHRDRARRVRRHGGPGHDRGPARGDRRRDPGRVRRGGAAGRAPRRRPGARRRAGVASRTCSSCGTSRRSLEDDDEYDTVGGLVYHRIGGVPSPGDEVRVDGLRLTVETTDGRRVGQGARGPTRPPDETRAATTTSAAQAPPVRR